MATLVYTRSINGFQVLHSDNVKHVAIKDYDSIELPIYDNWGEFVISFEKSIYESHVYFSDVIQEHECDRKYNPIILRNERKQFGNATFKEFFNIEEENVYLEFCHKHNITNLIVKTNIDLWYSMTNGYEHILTIGKPQKNELTIRWINRYTCPFYKVTQNEKYKKYIKVPYFSGKNNLYLTTTYTPQSFYPQVNFDNISTIDFEPIPYSNLSTKTEEEREMIMKQEIIKQQKLNEYKAKLEFQKDLDGYCDICGESNASYTIDPFDEDLNGVINMRWLCTDCYQNLMADI